MEKEIENLHNIIVEIDEDFGGDISFIPVVDAELFAVLANSQSWELPGILKYFLCNESNGLIIGNKRILSIRDERNKKTLVDNFERNNDAKKSPWFKGRPHIFNDYFVIASDGNICFCYSKKYNLFNPSVYICSNANSPKGVDFDKLDMDLAGLIQSMIDAEFT